MCLGRWKGGGWGGGEEEARSLRMASTGETRTERTMQTCPGIESSGSALSAEILIGVIAPSLSFGSDLENK